MTAGGNVEDDHRGMDAGSGAGFAAPIPGNVRTSLGGTGKVGVANRAMPSELGAGEGPGIGGALDDRRVERSSDGADERRGGTSGEAGEIGTLNGASEWRIKGRGGTALGWGPGVVAFGFGASELGGDSLRSTKSSNTRRSWSPFPSDT